MNGARLWVHVGSLRFQPGELAKIMLIVFLAGYMREKREVLAQGRLKDWGPLLVIWVLAMLVLLETKDLGGGLLYFGIFLAMLYMATARIAYVAVGLGLFLVGAVGVWRVTPHVQDRVTIWLASVDRAQGLLPDLGPPRPPPELPELPAREVALLHRPTAATEAPGSARGRSPTSTASRSSPI